MTWTTSHRIRTQHCDPAGLIFYPRYFEFLSVSVEDWCEAVFGVAPLVLREKRGLGLPTVGLKTRFVAPSGLGETLDWSIRPERIGSASCTLTHRVTCGGRLRVETEQALVLIDMTRRRSTPWPEDLRASLERAASRAG